MRYYVDTCIWLNLFKAEWPLNRRFEEFLDRCRDDTIFYSDMVLRELMLKLPNFEERRTFLEMNAAFVAVEPEDRRKARELESKYHFDISYADLLHLCMSNRLKAVLITRDRQLLEVSREENVPSKRPEDAGF